MRIRFTPPRVGTTRALEEMAGLWAVHPHARGDNPYHHDRRPCEYGSPPRAWGQLARWKKWRDCGRFTPTRVGSTHTIMIDANANTVHPHARGDNARAGRNGGIVGGSPPRAWGQPIPS